RRAHHPICDRPPVTLLPGAAPRDSVRERPEKGLDVFARPRGRVVAGGVEALRRAVELIFTDWGLVPKVGLVYGEHDGNLADRAEHGLDPGVEVLEGVVPRDVADREDPLGPVEIRLPEELAEPFRPHDVPVVELVEDEPPDQGGLADGVLADETDLRLHPTGFYHRDASSSWDGREKAHALHEVVMRRLILVSSI